MVIPGMVSQERPPLPRAPHSLPVPPGRVSGMERDCDRDATEARSGGEEMGTGSVTLVNLMLAFVLALKVCNYYPQNVTVVKHRT